MLVGIAIFLFILTLTKITADSFPTEPPTDQAGVNAVGGPQPPDPRPNNQRANAGRPPNRAAPSTPAAPPTRAAADQAQPLDTGDHLPLMIRWSNWQPAFGPAYVYARERDLQGMLQMDGPVEKMLMVTSYEEVERLMQRADELKAAGVTTVGLNTENGAGMTPANEMQTLTNPDPNVNIVARVARLAKQNGFKVMWGPIRNMVDRVSDDVIRTVMEAGVDGVALQEQKFIETQPAGQRLAAVEQTRERYLRLAREVGIENFDIDVQIMHQRCPDLQNCVAFVQGLEAMPVNSIAIWSNGPIPPEFVRSIRGG